MQHNFIALRVFAFILSLCTLPAIIETAQAQTSPQTPDAQNGEAQKEDGQTGDFFPDEILPGRLFHIDPKKRRSYIDVGIGALSFPAYLGSDKRSNFAVPYISAKYKGRWFLNPAIGTGLTFADTKHVTVAGGFKYIGGRDREDTPFDDASFDDASFDDNPFKIDGGLGVFGDVLLGTRYAALNLKANTPLTGDLKGYEFEARLLTMLPLAKNFRLSPSLSVTFHDKDWQNAFYGVTGAQSLYTQTFPLDYGGGLTSYGGSLIAFWNVTDSYSVVSIAGYKKLDKSFEQSPFVTQKDGASLIFSAVRRF